MIVTDSLAGLEKAWGKVSVTMRSRREFFDADISNVARSCFGCGKASGPDNGPELQVSPIGRESRVERNYAFEQENNC